MEQTRHKRTQLSHIADHSHILLIQVGVGSRVQAQALHLLPHDHPTRQSPHRLLHADLHNEQEAAHAEKNVGGGTQLGSARTVLLASSAIVTIIAEAASSLHVTVVATNAIATAQLAVDLTAGNGARELGLHLNVVRAHGVFHDGRLVGERVGVVGTEQVQTKASVLAVAHVVAAARVLQHDTRRGVVEI